MKPLPWHTAHWSKLAQAVRNDALPHAWLFSGPRGVGKRALAVVLAAALLCERRDADGSACGVCESCRMLVAGGHPDAHLLSLDGHLGLAADATLQHEDCITYWSPHKENKRRRIAIEGVRSLIEKFSMTRHRSRCKLAIIAPAEDLNPNSRDALLKLIEEPTADTFLILIAEQAQSLSATLRSRCQQQRLGYPAEAVALQWLHAQKPQIDAATLDAALAAAHGAPLLALHRLEQPDAPKELAWHTALDELARVRVDPLQLAASIDKGDVVEFLHACEVWLLQRLRPQAALVGNAAAQAAPNGRVLEQLISELRESRRRLEANTNGQLVLEAFLLGWLRLLARNNVSSPQSGHMREVQTYGPAQ